MKVSCQVIEDLLPLYVDDVCQEDTKEMIKNHLKTCNHCSSHLNELQKDEFNDKMVIQATELQLNSLKSLKRKFYLKYILIATALILIAGFLMFQIGFLLPVPQEAIAYQGGLITIQEVASDEVTLQIHTNDFYSEHHNYRVIDVDGSEQLAYFTYLTKKKGIFSNKELLIDTSCSSKTIINFSGEDEFVKGREIDRVYYLVTDYLQLKHLSDDEMNELLKEATLLWERE